MVYNCLTDKLYFQNIKRPKATVVLLKYLEPSRPPCTHGIRHICSRCSIGISIAWSSIALVACCHRNAFVFAAPGEVEEDAGVLLRAAQGVGVPLQRMSSCCFRHQFAATRDLRHRSVFVARHRVAVSIGLNLVDAGKESLRRTSASDLCIRARGRFRWAVLLP